MIERKINNEADLYLAAITETDDDVTYTFAPGSVLNLSQPFTPLHGKKITIDGGVGGVKFRFAGVVFNQKIGHIRNCYFEDFAGDGVQFWGSSGSVRNCRFSGHQKSTDEAVSAVKGASVEIAYNYFDRVNKCILLGTGDDEDRDLDLVSLVSVHHNRFVDCERRMPYTGVKTHVYNNWVQNWWYKGVQSFAIKSRGPHGKALVEYNIFEQRAGLMDGFPLNHLQRGGSWRMAQTEGSGKLCFRDNWVHKDTSFLDIQSNDDGQGFYADATIMKDEDNLKAALAMTCGPAL